MIDAVVGLGAAVALGGLTVLYARRYRGAPQAPFDAGAAWVRAGIWFSLCWLFSVATGTFGRVVGAPVVTAAQVGDAGWWAATGVATLTILVGYGVIWGRWTLHFGRPRDRAGQVLFGVLWGTSTGQLFVATWDLWARTGWPAWGIWLGAWCTLATFQGLFHDLWWDVWVVPEHDTAWSIRWKVVATHVPNLTVTLTHLAVYEDRLLFVALQTLALVAASLHQRVPVPWNPAPTPAAATAPGLFGLPHACGHRTDDPDPYATQRAADRAG